MGAVEERSVSLRRCPERDAGDIRSANADMSNEIRVRILYAENPRFPAQRSSSQGESVPKARPKGVVDGQQVNIPVLNFIAMGGRRRLSQPGVGYPGESM